MTMFPVCTMCRSPILDGEHECEFKEYKVCDKCWTMKAANGECNCE